ncbi:hypothetical protein NDU88_010368 [Pleurodeles waltl]|uniref:Uncharacterized protein n=1 Tax=Pleurodeles waltl TaxID=8319 RepID=A0AAV7QU69_PLEWA|nr:hypothetical protein NDU88_010368 [Pleurodeles waltl]
MCGSLHADDIQMFVNYLARTHIWQFGGGEQWCLAVGGAEDSVFVVLCVPDFIGVFLFQLGLVIALVQCPARLEGSGDDTQVSANPEEPSRVELLAAIQGSRVALEGKIKTVAVEVNLLRADLQKVSNKIKVAGVYVELQTEESEATHRESDVKRQSEYELENYLQTGTLKKLLRTKSPLVCISNGAAVLQQTTFATAAHSMQRTALL